MCKMLSFQPGVINLGLRYFYELMYILFHTKSLKSSTWFTLGAHLHLMSHISVWDRQAQDLSWAWLEQSWGSSAAQNPEQPESGALCLGEGRWRAEVKIHFPDYC